MFELNKELSEDISMYDLLNTLSIYKVFIFRVSLVFLILSLFFSFAFSYFRPPLNQYEAFSTIEMESEDFLEEDSKSNNMNAFIHILRSQSTIDEVNKNFDLSYGFSLKNIVVKEMKDQGLFKISIMYPSKSKVILITNFLVDYVLDISNSTLMSAKFYVKNESTLTDHETIINKKVNFVLNAFIGSLLGILISVFIILIMENTSRKIRNIQDLQKSFSLEVLTVLPTISKLKKKRGWWPW